MEQEDKLRDGGHTIIACPGCKRKLADIWVVDDTYPKLSKIRATCGCGDQSFYEEVKGRFYAGHTEQSTIIDVQTVSSETREGILHEEILLKTVAV